MKLILLGLTLSGLLCLGFSAWGLYTPAGRIRFDEMAGIIPYMSGLVGWVFIGAGVVLGAYMVFKAGQ